MTTIKTVGIKDLKNNLSAYLREVRLDTRILVSDRNRVIAELREPATAYATPESDDPILSEWARAGIVILPTRKKGKLPESPVKLDDAVVLRALEEARKDSGE